MAARAASNTVIIGAARGIGANTALRLSREPWAGTLLLADLDLAGAEAQAAELRKAGTDARAAYVDLADPTSIATLARDAGDVHAVAVVAAVLSSAASLEIDAAEFERVLRVNLVGVYLAAREFATGMMSRGRGAIVAVASIAGHVPRRDLPAYCASKAGMAMALRVLAMETVPAGVRINLVSPGATATDMNRDWLARNPEVDITAGDPGAYRLPVLDRRIGQPADVANAIAFLLSPESEHIALHDLVIDGGESLGLG